VVLVSVLTVSVELSPIQAGQSAVIMRPHTATTFGPLITVGLGLLVSGLLLARPAPHARPHVSPHFATP